MLCNTLVPSSLQPKSPTGHKVPARNRGEGRTRDNDSLHGLHRSPHPVCLGIGCEEETKEENFKPENGCAMYATTIQKKSRHHPSARIVSSSIVVSMYHMGANAQKLLLSAPCTACSNEGNKEKSHGYSGTSVPIFTAQITDNLTSKDKTMNGNIFRQFG